MDPSQLFVLSFVLLIILGSLGFRYLPGLYVEQPLSWLDSLFTATSAVCVTGLIVVDTASSFTLWGQIYLLILIQLGGLGMLTLTSMIIATLGGRLSLRAEAIAVGNRQGGPYVDAKRLVIDVFRFSIFIELIGAVTLLVFWIPQMGLREAIWPAIFHSVSAFCNAGFSTYSDSLVQFQGSPGTTITISMLIVIGGLGLLSLEELYQSKMRRRKTESQHQRPLSVQTILVLSTTAVLILSGWVLFLIFEWSFTLDEMSLPDKLHNSLMMSVTARTAGFNSIDYQSATNSSNFLTILLMMIGGSPGSTTGGMKTTTFALLGLLAWSRLRGERTTSFARRSIPDETIQRAVGLFVMATGVVVVAVLALATSEAVGTSKADFLPIMFEAVSAFNTVGLSMGVTEQLSPFGKCLMIALMFLGRVGPLALVSAFIVRRTSAAAYRYANEDVIVG
jgi:trk system potassium uptake protein TrkH